MKLLRRVMMRAKEVAAQVSVSGVVDAFYDDFATEESGRYWWWCQMVLMDPNELIVNDGYDKLYRIAFTISGDSVTFGEASPVKIEYVDIAAKAEQVAAACAGIATVRGEKVAARYHTRAESCPDRKEGGNMKELISKLRAKFNLPADASDEEVLRVAAEAPAPEGQPEPEPAPEEQQPEQQPGEGAPAPEPEPGTVETESGQGTTTVDASALAQLREDARMGREAREQQITSEDEALLLSAVKCGKFPPARKEHFATLLKADREGTRTLIESLEENVVPVQARGLTPETEAQGGNSGYPVSWLPEVAARKAAQAAAAEGEHPRVVMGGD